MSNYEVYFQKWKTWFLKEAERNNYPKIQAANNWIKRFKKYKVKNLYGRSKRLMKIKVKGGCITKYRLFLQYGKGEGLKRWFKYCNKQAFSNSREYKKMTEQKFKDYNKSRAVTLENLCKKYGVEEGLKRWNIYLDKQKYTKSRERYITEYGLIKGSKIFENIKNSKIQNIENYIKRYGEAEGIKKFEYYLSRKVNFGNSSKEAFKIFTELEKILYSPCLYKPKTQEYILYGQGYKAYYLYDFFCKKNNIIIEYQGSIFHGNPNIYEAQDTPNYFNRQERAVDMWERDKLKHETALKYGYRLIVLWDTFAKSYKNEIISILYNIIMDTNIKYKELI